MTSDCWQLTKKKLPERMQHVLETGQWSDCTFIVGKEPQQQTFKCHTWLLSMCSPVFETMFFGNWEKIDPIPIIDVQPEAFKIFLEYMYHDKLELTSVRLTYDVYYCADKYMLPYLKDDCIKFLMSILSPKNVCIIYEIAMLFKKLEHKELLDKNQSIHDVLDKCLKVIRTKANEVLKGSAWKKIKLETLLTVLDQHHLQIKSEVELFHAVERWAMAECQRKDLDPANGNSLRSVIGNALSKIRFLSLTYVEFVTKMYTSSLFMPDEAGAILSNICWNNIPEEKIMLQDYKNKVSMPEGFCTDRNKRMWSLMVDSTNCECNLKKRKFCSETSTSSPNLQMPTVPLNIYNFQ